MGTENKSFEEFELRGYTVHIVRSEPPERPDDGDEPVKPTEEVWIDGKRQQFLRSEDGYRIGFAPLEETLREAVESYLRYMPEKN